MRLPEAKKVLAVLQAAYPRMDIEQPTLNVYAQDLLDLDAETAVAACELLRKTSPFFPTVAEIRGAYARLKLQVPPAAEAFRQACGPGPRHELVERARRLVGDSWHWRSTEAHFLRRPFMEAFDEVVAAAVLEVQAPGLLDRGAEHLVRPKPRQLPAGVEDDEDEDRGPEAPPPVEFLEAAERLRRAADARQRSLIRPDQGA